MTKKSILFSLMLAILISSGACKRVEDEKSENETGFRFAFLTDIHLMPYRNAEEGFDQAIEKVNELSPAFVVTGGDLVMDALSVTYTQADSQYNMYDRMLKKFRMPVYNTIGNHEVYGWYEKSGADSSHPEYGKSMFEKRIAPRFRAETIEGWKFFFLDSVIENGKGGYMGGIDEEQKQWIAEELAATDTTMPLVISTHIPLMTLAAQVYDSATAPNVPGVVVTNSKDILELFSSHNLKLVLQGHLHYYEVMELQGITFITSGAVSAAWWKGPYYNTEEGFLLVDCKGDDFSWEYVDYGWEVPEDSPDILF